MTATHFAITVVQPVGGTPSAEQLEPVMHALGQLNEEIRAAGAFVFTGGLAQPGSSSVVRPSAGGTVVSDGPYVEAREFVGGLWVLRTSSRDDVLGWARRITQITGLPTQVSPVLGGIEGLPVSA